RRTSRIRRSRRWRGEADGHAGAGTLAAGPPSGDGLARTGRALRTRRARERGQGRRAMKERELRKRCRKLLNQLDIGPPLDVELLCERLGGRRGKPIRLMAYPLEVPGPFGCWIATASADYIFYQAETTKSHHDHIILHELGHMLADHHPHGDAEPADFLRGPATDLDPDAVHRALRRSSYDDAHE